MDAIWDAADEWYTTDELLKNTYHSLTGNEWIDLLLVVVLLLLPTIFFIWYIEREIK